MPHQCTNCGYVFADGSKEMLSGCPECGGATFQFHPDDTEIPDDPPDESPPDPEGGRVGHRVGRATSTVREWVSGGSSTTADGTDSTIDESDGPNSKADASDRSDEISDDETLSDDSSTSDTPEATDEGDMVSDESDMDEADVLGNDANAPEDTAQASARSEFVSPDKIPSSSSPSSSSSETQTTSSLSSPPGDGRVVREPTGDQPDLAELREELNDQFESIKVIEPGEYELNLMRLYNREEYIIALQENGRYIIQMPETWMGSDDE